MIIITPEIHEAMNRMRWDEGISIAKISKSLGIAESTVAAHTPAGLSGYVKKVKPVVRKVDFHPPRITDESLLKKMVSGRA